MAEPYFFRNSGTHDRAIKFFRFLFTKLHARTINTIHAMTQVVTTEKPKETHCSDNRVA